MSINDEFHRVIGGGSANGTPFRELNSEDDEQYDSGDGDGLEMSSSFAVAPGQPMLHRAGTSSTNNRKKLRGQKIKKYFEVFDDTCCGEARQSSVRAFVWGIFSTRASKYGTLSTYWPSRLFEISIIVLILSNVSISILLTDSEYSQHEGFREFGSGFETFSFCVFFVEYFLRLWSCVESHRYQGACSGRMVWVTRPLSILDLVVLIAFTIDMVATFRLDNTSTGHSNYTFVRLLRMFTILRIERQSKGIKRLWTVLKRKIPELFITVFVAIMLLVFSATLIFTVEPDQFTSISEGIWWASQTLTTVGYGDLYPRTMPGKVIGVCTGFLGVCLFALPASILGSGLMEIVEEKKKESDLTTLTSAIRKGSRHGGLSIDQFKSMGLNRRPKFSEIFDPENKEHLKLAAALLHDTDDSSYGLETPYMHLWKQYTPEDGGYVGLHAAIAKQLALKYLKNFFEGRSIGVRPNATPNTKRKVNNL
jgi:voltage-gated potassium channel